MNKKATVTGIACALVLAGVFTLPSACGTGGGSGGEYLAVVGGTLVDGTGAAATEDANVIVEDGKISCVGARDRCPAPAGARVLDAAGKWITPGLIDAHVHFSQSGWIDARPQRIWGVGTSQ
jgi:N-acyl-D-aspartate/D-glutamate deacylase